MLESLPRLSTLSAGALLLALSACNTPQSTTQRPVVEAPDSAFAYLVDQFDQNGDQRIDRQEFEASGRSFEQLDRDADGWITGADFERAGLRVRPLRDEEARRARALHLLAWYFQSDVDPATVSDLEIAEAFAAYDRNGDGRVGRSEFESLAGQRQLYGRRPIPRFNGLLEIVTTDPFERLIEGVDIDQDSFLQPEELGGFRRKNARDPAWTVAAAEVVPIERSLEGEHAPDFELLTPDGSRSIRLSGFAGDRPVALIFGSYT